MCVVKSPVCDGGTRPESRPTARDVSLHQRTVAEVSAHEGLTFAMEKDGEKLSD